MSDETVNLNIKIDSELRKRFKASASINGETMTDVMLKMIKEYIKTNEKKMG